MIVENIEQDSSYLSGVKDLWRKHSETLGYLPEGAFKEYAAKHSIIIARGAHQELFGYLLYRVVRRGGCWPSAVIVHLCVDSKHRDKGVARDLVQNLCNKIKGNFLKLEADCRRDYDLGGFWQRLDFVYKGERPGRSGLPVVRWEMTFRELPLIALAEQGWDKKRFRAVIDANILYRLQDPIPVEDKAARVLSQEVKSLQADWLQDDVAQVITNQTLNEIERNNDPSERQHRLAYATQFANLRVHDDRVATVEKHLIDSFPNIRSEGFKSDLKQLAHAICADAHFFITQDTYLFKKRKVFQDAFGIRVLSPGEFVVRIDEEMRRLEYQPSSLAGSRALAISRLRSDQLAALYDVFRLLARDEKKNQFEAHLRSFLAQPEMFEVELCTQTTRPVALIVYSRENPSRLNIPLIRIVHSAFPGTLLRHLLRRVILLSVAEQRPFVCVTDDEEQTGLQDALQESGYTAIGKEWVKCSMQLTSDSTDLLAKIRSISEQFPDMNVLDPIAASLSEGIERQDPLIFYDLERRLWPTKILDANIPTYIIPIRPEWAQHLFDEHIARQTLWGSTEDLALRNENVYYRNKRSSYEMTSPARILWYVSRSKHLRGSMAIRACSFLDEVVVGPAKTLYHQFERLGVYDWKDVLRTARGSAENHIMALKFSHTAMLPEPVDLSTVREILEEEEGKLPVLQSPQRITPRTFARILQAANILNGVKP